MFWNRFGRAKHIIANYMLMVASLCLKRIDQVTVVTEI